MPGLPREWFGGPNTLAFRLKSHLFRLLAASCRALFKSPEVAETKITGRQNTRLSSPLAEATFLLNVVIHPALSAAAVPLRGMDEATVVPSKFGELGGAASGEFLASGSVNPGCAGVDSETTAPAVLSVFDSTRTFASYSRHP